MHSTLPLFGGALPWDTNAWTDSDDRVRGGASHSFLTAEDSNLDSDSNSASAVRFHGTLDIDTLGGAGFASQRTRGEKKTWDVSGWEGVRVVVRKDGSDDKRYTLILKDTILPKSPDGREQSTISWETDVTLDTAAGAASEDNKNMSVFTPASPESSSSDDDGTVTFNIPFSSFRPFYRGKPAPHAAPLAKSEVRRWSIMMRSHFGAQQGAFSLVLVSIEATRPHRAALSQQHSSSSDSTTRSSNTKPAPSSSLAATTTATTPSYSTFTTLPPSSPPAHEQPATAWDLEHLAERRDAHMRAVVRSRLCVGSVFLVTGAVLVGTALGLSQGWDLRES